MAHTVHKTDFIIILHQLVSPAGLYSVMVHCTGTLSTVHFVTAYVPPALMANKPGTT